MELIRIDWKKLRKGESVECPHCKEGKLVSPNDYETTHFFKFNKCGMKINCD